MKYYIQARLFPTILTSVPLFIVAHLLLEPYRAELNDVVAFLPDTLQLALYSGLVFLAIQINRIVSIEIFENVVLGGELHRPSVSRLMATDKQMDETVKMGIRRRIISQFGIDILNREQEMTDERRARIRLASGVAQMRTALRGNKMLLQHNIEYGFIRNLIGGALLAVVVSAGLYIYCRVHHLKSLESVSVAMVIVYMIPVLLSKPVLRWFSRRYTSVLFNEYYGTITAKDK